MRIIKESLEIYDDTFYRKLYEDGPKMKPYTFSINLDIKGFKKDTIFLNKPKVLMFFSTDNESIGSKFMLAFLTTKNLEFKFSDGLSVNIVSIETQELITTDKNLALIQIVSPLVVQSHSRNNDYFYVYDEAGFIEELLKVINSQIIALNYEGAVGSFDLIPYKPKKTIVKFYEKSIHANRGKFIMQASSDLINWLQLVGLGSKRSSGFGKFIILNY